MVATVQGSRPGKTAPKLFQDFLIFDPKCGHPNVLVDLPPPQGEGPQLAPRLEACRHDYTLKSDQSVLPPLDLRTDGNTAYRVAVVCKKCRIHADVQVDSSPARAPCPTNDHQLHHYQYQESRHTTSAERIQYVWQCSIDECQTILSITYRIPRITDADIAVLTTPDLLKRRYEALLQEDPDRKDVKQALPLQPLSRVRTYVRDSLSGKHTKLPAHNKRFQEACGVHGQDCRGLLERLGFEYAVGQLTSCRLWIDPDVHLQDAGDEGHVWLLPQPGEVPDRLEAKATTLRELLEDVERELGVIMAKMAAETGWDNPSLEPPMASADMDIQRTLGATGCESICCCACVCFTRLTELLQINDKPLDVAQARQTLTLRTLFASTSLPSSHYSTH